MGILPLNSGTIFYLTLLPASLTEVVWGGSFARFGGGEFQLATPAFFVFVTQTFGIKNHANPKFTSRGNFV